MRLVPCSGYIAGAGTCHRPVSAPCCARCACRQVLSASTGTPATDLHPVGLAMLVLQCVGFASYLANRCITLLGAWREVVWPACCVPRAVREEPSFIRECC